MRVGVLTGGGDCPGLNAVIRAVVRRGISEFGLEFVGFRDGWRGPLEADTVPLDVNAVRGILPRGGTILGSSRTNPFKENGPGRNGVERIKDNLAGLGVDALVVIGGEDTLGVSARLWDEGIPVVGVPKTIDNDLGATDYTFGFDTAVNIAMEAIDRLHTTAESHHRALIVEVMGRHAGWIALHAGLAGGANVILIPERPFDIDKVCAYVEHRFQTRYAPIVVVAEGAHPTNEELLVTTGQLDAFGHVRLGGVGQYLAEEIEKRTGKEARCTVLGHIQRGGTPTAFDRVLATRFGLHAGLAGGANVILIPERPFDIERVCGYVQHRFQTRFAPIVVVAEGAHPISEELATSTEHLDSFGHVRLGGVGQMLAEEIEKRTGKEARYTVLGHIQRGGTPTAFDRVLATRFGVHAVQAVHEEAFGVMVALRGTDIIRVSLAEATSQLKLVPPQRYAEAEVFFG